MNRTILAAALATLMLAQSADAMDPVYRRGIEEKDLASGKVSLDPTKGYIYAHDSVRRSAIFFKAPTDEERAEFQAEWQEAFDKAAKQYQRDLATWEKGVEWANEKRSKPPPKPVEPTAETFYIGRVEDRMIVGYGPTFRLFESGGSFRLFA